MSIEWLGEQFKEDLKAHVKGVAADAGRVLTDTIWGKIGTPYPPASLPGEPPHARTRDLQDSYDYIVTDEGDSIVLTVGSPLYYSILLEQGGDTNWGHVDPRPHVVVAFEEAVDEMVNVVFA